MHLRTLSKALASLSLLACTTVFATPVTYVITAVPSIGEQGNAANFVTTIDVGANATINSATFNVNLTANSPSYLNEMTVLASDSTVTHGAFFTPGFADETSGTADYAVTVDLVASGFTFNVGADGLLRLEFLEAYDDPETPIDGVWNFGTITFDVDALSTPPAGVPEPASVLLIGAGFAMMGYAGRRRTSALAAKVTKVTN